MKNTIHKKIHGYAAMAAAFLGCEPATAEIEYTDIEPDYVLDIDFEVELIDMNNDGNYDFGFIQQSYYSFPWFEYYKLIRKPLCGPLNSDNAIAGSSDYWFAWHLYYPYALAPGVEINNSLSFQNWFYQSLAYFRFQSYATGDGDWWTNTRYAGNWFPEVVDHYLGVRFLDILGKQHYGWIRLDVLDTAKVVVIKDYAYEKFPNTPIKAGDKIGDTTQLVMDEDVFNTSVESQMNLPGVEIYAFDQTIYINNQSELTGLQIRVYNAEARLIKTGIAGNGITLLPLEVPATGFYLVHVSTGKQVYLKKVFI